VNTDPGHNRLLWRCRRGMLELDCLLRGYAERHLAALDAAQRARFAALLDLPDQTLLAILLGQRPPPDPALAPLVAAIRRAARPA